MHWQVARSLAPKKPRCSTHEPMPSRSACCRYEMSRMSCRCIHAYQEDSRSLSPRIYSLGWRILSKNLSICQSDCNFGGFSHVYSVNSERTGPCEVGPGTVATAQARQGESQEMLLSKCTAGRQGWVGCEGRILIELREGSEGRGRRQVGERERRMLALVWWSGEGVQGQTL